MLQAPISRLQGSYDRTLSGKTTQVPQTNIKSGGTPFQIGDTNVRSSYFRYHARAAPNARAQSGTYGSGEDGNVFGSTSVPYNQKVPGGRLPLGSDPKTWSPSSGRGFGTDNPSPSFHHHFKGTRSMTHPGDMDYTTKRGDKDFHRGGHNVALGRRSPFMGKGSNLCGGRVFKKITKPSWNTKDNIAAPKHYQ